MSDLSDYIKWQDSGEKAYRQAVADQIAEAVKAEREACAAIAETDSVLDWRGGSTGSAKGTATRIAAVIRGRGEE